MKKDKSKRLSDWEKKFSKEVKIETSKEFFHETDEGININPSVYAGRFIGLHFQ
jgi:hypothetical protein